MYRERVLMILKGDFDYLAVIGPQGGPPQPKPNNEAVAGAPLQSSPKTCDATFAVVRSH